MLFRLVFVCVVVVWPPAPVLTHFVSHAQDVQENETINIEIKKQKEETMKTSYFAMRFIFFEYTQNIVIVQLYAFS